MTTNTPNNNPDKTPKSALNTRERVERMLKMSDEEIAPYIATHPAYILLEYMSKKRDSELKETLSLINNVNERAVLRAIINKCRLEGGTAPTIVKIWKRSRGKPGSKESIDEFMNTLLAKIPFSKDILKEAKQPDRDDYIKQVLVLKNDGNYKDVLGVAEKAIENYPNVEFFYVELAYAAEKLGDKNAALKAWQGALKLSPDNGWYKACIKNIEQGLGIAKEEPSEDTESIKELPSDVREKLEQMSLEQAASYIRKIINTIDDLQYKTAITESEDVQLANYLLLLPLLQEYYEERKGSEIEDEDTEDQTGEDPEKEQTDDQDQSQEEEEEQIDDQDQSQEEESVPDDKSTEENTSEFESKKVDELLDRGDRLEIWRAIGSFRGAIDLREITKDNSNLEQLKLGLARLEVFYVKEFGTLIPPKDSMTPPFGKQPDLVDEEPENTFPEGELPSLPKSEEDDQDAEDETEDEATEEQADDQSTEEGEEPAKATEQEDEETDDSAETDPSQQAEMLHIPLPELNTLHGQLLAPDSPDADFELLIESLAMDKDLLVKLGRKLTDEKKEESDRKIWQHSEDIRRIKRFLRERQYAESLNKDGALQFRPSSIPGVKPSADPTNGGTTSEAPNLDILGDQQQEEAIPLPSPFASVDLSPEEEGEDTETDEDDEKSVDDEMIEGAISIPEPTERMSAIFAPLTIREGEHIEIGILTSNRKGNRLITVEENAGLTLGQGLPGAQIKVSETSYYKIKRGDNWSIKNGVITFS